MTTTEKISVYEIITNQILDLLDQGIVPWKMMWRTGVPQNLISKRPYEGINAIMLAIIQDQRNYSSPYWLTMKQCNEKGGKVRKGEKSSIVAFWKRCEKQKKDDEDDDTFFVLRYYRVFNVDQCEGITVTHTVTQPVGKIEACEKIVDSYKDCPLIEWGGDRACYSQTYDKVRMPPRERFFNTEEVYSALFHELGHSTGHEKRLNRPEVSKDVRFGMDAYSREELVAEFCSAFLCGITGIAPKTIENSSAYIQEWRKRISDDKKLVISAAGKAQKAANYIQGIVPQYSS